MSATTMWRLAKAWRIENAWHSQPLLVRGCRPAVYLGTWSASEQSRNETRRDPLDEIRENRRQHESPAAQRDIAWVLHLRTGNAGTESRTLYE
jgi:hypothetical protein